MTQQANIETLSADVLDTQWAAMEKSVSDGDLTLDQAATLMEQAFTTGLTPVLP